MMTSLRFDSAESFRKSLEERLRAEASRSKVPLQRVRKHVVFERFLGRLLKVRQEGWALKGAVALNFRLGTVTRTTNDLDLGTSIGQAALDRIVRDATDVDLGDYLQFVITGRDTQSYQELTLLRFSIESRLAGRTFETFHIDVAIVREMDFVSDQVLAPALLSFADIDPVSVPTIPLESHIADKVHALTRPRGGRLNTRVKDLADLVMLASTPHFNFDTEAIAVAIVSIFRIEPTHDVPEALPGMPAVWNAEYRRIAETMDIEADLLDINEGEKVVHSAVDPALRRACEIISRASAVHGPTNH